MKKFSNLKKFIVGSITAVLVASSGAPMASASFNDVSVNNPHAAYIYRAVEMGLINGYEDGSFKPYQNITRGQVVKIIARYIGDVDTAGTEQFTDVSGTKDTELAEAALEVRAIGIFNGSNGALNWTKPISRQEIATVLVRLFNLTDREDVEANVTDLNIAWEVHRENIEILSENGITTMSAYNPLGKVTRGQFASFMSLGTEMQVSEIVEVSELETITVQEGGELELPEKVEVTYDNGTTRQAEVRWKTEAVDTAAPGTYEVVGTIFGTELTAFVKVIVEAAEPGV